MKRESWTKCLAARRCKQEAQPARRSLVGAQVECVSSLSCLRPVAQVWAVTEPVGWPKMAMDRWALLVRPWAWAICVGFSLTCLGVDKQAQDVWHARASVRSRPGFPYRRSECSLSLSSILANHYIRQFNKHVPYCLSALFGSKTDPYTPSLLSSCFPSILSSQLDQILNRIPLFLSHSANHPHMTQVNKERRLGLQPAIQNRQYASLVSVPEPVPDHIRISQYTVGSTSLDPASSPHGHPALEPSSSSNTLMFQSALSSSRTAQTKP
ncbi:hypothetical protein DY000_02037112 [Brassica cretica]|uniref:Uncharacterized protein n=1 Tax=Brassica cretica TaxID=69181 RepID=A0ABQ7BI10_BRACR|nr:hypothetical protein DY000_02037112 [Brassica cretica]